MATIVAQLRANEGYLRIALRLLTEIGWLAQDSTGAYQVTARSSLAGQIPNNVSELATTHPTASGHGQPVEHWLSIWLEHSANGWDVADPVVAELLDGALSVSIFKQLKGFGGARVLEAEADESAGLSAAMVEALREYFVKRKWGYRDQGKFRFKPTSNEPEPEAVNLPRLAFPANVLHRLDDLLFGDPGSNLSEGPESDDSKEDQFRYPACDGVIEHFAGGRLFYAPVFLMSAAGAGLFPHRAVSRRCREKGRLMRGWVQ